MLKLNLNPLSSEFRELAQVTLDGGGSEAEVVVSSDSDYKVTNNLGS